MNFFQKLLTKVFGSTAGPNDYRKLIDLGKQIAPIAQPLIEAALAKKGLPTNAVDAQHLLVGAAISHLPISAVDASILKAVIAVKLGAS